jgi:cytochrome bd-type quinol oxidase subunit 2
MPQHIRKWDASALSDTQFFMLTGMMFLIPTILVAYTASRYWVFRGKVTGGTEHH